MSGFIVYNLTGDVVFIGNETSRMSCKLLPEACVRFLGDSNRALIMTAIYVMHVGSMFDTVYLLPHKYVQVRKWKPAYLEFGMSPEYLGWVEVEEGQFIDQAGIGMPALPEPQETRDSWSLKVIAADAH